MHFTTKEFLNNTRYFDTMTFDEKELESTLHIMENFDNFHAYVLACEFENHFFDQEMEHISRFLYCPMCICKTSKFTEIVNGYPGEYFLICKKCNTVLETEFNESEII